jgi:hypothetical protein
MAARARHVCAVGGVCMARGVTAVAICGGGDCDEADRAGCGCGGAAAVVQAWKQRPRSRRLCPVLAADTAQQEGLRVGDRGKMKQARQEGRKRGRLQADS